MPVPETPDATEDAVKQQETHGVNDFDLPKTIVTRLAKSSLPDNAKFQKQAVESIVVSATVFINYLAAAAQDVTWARSAKNVTAADVLKALEIIEFDDQIGPMKRELEAFKALQDPSKPKSRAKRPRAADDASVTPSERDSTSKPAEGDRETVQESRSEVEPEEGAEELEDEPEQAEAFEAEEDESMETHEGLDEADDEEDGPEEELDASMDIEGNLHAEEEDMIADDDD